MPGRKSYGWLGRRLFPQMKTDPDNPDNPQAPSTIRKDSPGQAGHKINVLKQTEPREKYGLFPLNSSEEANYSIDIIAVHGLNGDWEETWTDTNGLLWLRDFLPLQLPEARIMSFGYNATSTFSNSINDIEDVAAMVLDRLDGKRQSVEQKDRPLIFISHSLGGIIVKKALILAHERSVHYGDLLNSVQGLVFFGVPHRGADAAYWGQFSARLLRALQLGSGANLKLLEGLGRNSKTLAEISKQFIERAQSLQIRTFYETEMLFNQLVVDRDSTRLNLPNEVPVGIDGADHISLCKFSSINSEKYHQVASAITKLAYSVLDMAPNNIAFRSRKGCFVLPFKRDRKFVGREDIIKSIEHRFQTQGRVALTGIGGIGKSQIAIEYCYRYHERYPNGHVFWVYADNIPRIREAYKKIAQALELPGWDTKDFDVFQHVLTALGNETHQWLLVIDNADDRDLFFGTPLNVDSRQWLRLADFLPEGANGSILITTRDRVVGQRLTDEAPIKIEPMTKSDAKELLQLKAPQEHRDESNQAMSDELLQILEHLPLAITQAAAFMRETGTSVEEYLLMLRKDSTLEHLLNEDRPDLRRDASSLNSVTQTWRVSFERIRDKWHRAAELLSLIVMLDRQSIPKFLLQEEGESPVSFREALATLEAYSLIVAEGKASFGVHRLVQISTQLWLQIHKETDKWQEKAIKILAEAFPARADEYENWRQCQPLYSHAQVVIQYNVTSKFDRSDLSALYASLLQNVASYDIGQGRYGLAYERGSKAYPIRERELGAEHPDTLKSLYYVAMALYFQGKYIESEKKQRQVNKIQQRILGYEHPDTLETANQLGNILERQCKYQEAEKLHRQTLEIRQRILGDRHPVTWKSMNNLAVAFFGQGKYKEAEKLHQQSVEIRREVLGPDHPHTWTSINNLAITYHGQGKVHEAEELLRQGLKIRRKILGPDHPDTWESINYLALTYQRQGKFREAEELLQQGPEICRKTLGPEHPDTLMSMNNLAITFGCRGKYREAEELHRQTLQIRQKVLGPKHADTLTSMGCLATTLQDQGKHREAEELHQQISKIRQAIPGPEHTDPSEKLQGGLGHVI